MTSSPSHSVFHYKSYVVYLTVVLLNYFIHFDNVFFVKQFITFMSDLIPSIKSLSSIAPNHAKSAFELTLAWLVSLCTPMLFLHQVDWSIIRQNHYKLGLGYPILGTLVIILSIAVLLFALIAPITPDTGRRSILLSIWLKFDVAFVLGCLVILTAGFCWSALMASLLQYFKRR